MPFCEVSPSKSGVDKMIQYAPVPYKHIKPRKFCPSLFIDRLHVRTPKSLTTTDPLWLGDIGVVLSAKTEGDNSVPPAFAEVGRNMCKILT